MTRSGSSPAVQFSDVDSAVEALRNAGLRATTTRRLILDVLFAAHGTPLAADAIVAAAAERKVQLDVTSVYRNLETFERAGIVRHVHLGHGAGLYVLVGDGEREYLYCECCGAARAVSPAELDEVRALLAGRFGHVARFTHFPIVGLCSDCASSR